MKENSELSKGIADKKNFPTGKEDKVTLTQRIQAYVEANSKKVMIVSTSIIVVTVLIFVVKGIVEKNAEENKQLASLKISRILPYYQQGDFKKAFDGDPSKTIRNDKVIGLNEIISKYGGTKQAKFAAVFAGNSLLAMNRTSEAVQYFEKGLDSPASIIVEAANAGLGICSENSGKYKEAAEYYQKAALVAISPASIGKYEYFEAICREKIGEKEAAEKLYREIILENKSDYVGLAKSSLSRLGMIIE